MADNPAPTRMELLRGRARIKLAKKGHKLLKQKRDALILEFFKILEKAKDLRSELNHQMALSYKSLAVAQAYHGINEVESASMAVARAPSVGIEVRNIMGVKIPSISVDMAQRPLLLRGYSVIGTSAKIDEAVESFEAALVLVVKLAETENATRKLIREIEKTKRRVNALEYVLMPKLEMQAKLIAFRLEEMERDSFVMLKMIKKKLEKPQYSAEMEGRKKRAAV